MAGYPGNLVSRGDVGNPSPVWSNTRLAMAKKSKDARVYVIMECTETGQRTYMAQKNTKKGYKLELKKYNPKLRKHTIYKERKK